MSKSFLPPKLCTAFLLLVSFDLVLGKNGESFGIGSTSSSVRTAAERGLNDPDRFVHAAPMIVGVKCSDGVILLAAHTPDDEEPLLYYHPSSASSSSTAKSQPDENLGDTTASVGLPAAATEAGSLSASSSVAANAVGSLSSFFRDLPPHYAGPFRVHIVDPPSRLALVSTGWRADCDATARKARALASRERSRYHHGIAAAATLPRAGGRMEEEERAMGIVVSQDLSLHLARCSASESTRALSCAGLIATPYGLWLIDATGAFPIRALCVGGGTVLVGGSEEGGDMRMSTRSIPASELVNRRLMQVSDWTQIDCLRALERILCILENPSEDAKVVGGSRHGPPAVRKGTRLEVAFVRRSGVVRQRLKEEAEFLETSAV